MATLSRLWESINDFVVLHGSKGCQLSKAFDNVGLHNDDIRRRFTQKLRDQGKYEITEITLSEKASNAEKQANVSSKYGSSLLCKAKSVADFWKAVGIETFLSIPDSHLLTSLLELLGMARGHGILTTEACQMLGVSQLYTVIERGVALGVIVKRTIIPGPAGTTIPASRVKSRTVILHLRRFAAEYNPITDRASFEADDQMKEDVCRYIKKFMRTYSRTSVFFTDIDNAIGCCARTLRNAFADELQKRDTGIRLYGLTIREDSEGTSMYSGHPRGRISFVLVDDDIIRPSLTVSPASGQDLDECSPEVIANAALYEQTSARIRWNGSKGVLSHHIRSIHCLFPKRNDRLINDLRTIYNYSVNKQQCGKQAAYRIYLPPLNRDATIASDDNDESKGLDGRTNEPNDKKKADAGVMTERKSDRLRFILDLLQKEGGVRSLQQISFSLRQDEAVRGVGFTADRKTVARCVQQLQIDGKITQVSVPIPTSVDNQSSTARSEASADAASCGIPLSVPLGQDEDVGQHAAAADVDPPHLQHQAPLTSALHSKGPAGPSLFKRGDTIQLVLLNEAGNSETLVAAFLQRQSDEEDQRLRRQLQPDPQTVQVAQTAEYRHLQHQGPRSKNRMTAGRRASSAFSSCSSQDHNGKVTVKAKRKKKKRVVQESSDSSVESSDGAGDDSSAAVADDSSDSGSDQLYNMAAASAFAKVGATAKGGAAVALGAAKRKGRARSKPPASAPIATDSRMPPSSLCPGEEGGSLPSAPRGTDEPLAVSNESSKWTNACSTGSFQKRKLPVELAFVRLLDSFEATKASGADSRRRPDDEDVEEMTGQNRSVCFGTSRSSGGTDGSTPVALALARSMDDEPTKNDEATEEFASEFRPILSDCYSSNSTSLRKRKGTDVPLDERQLSEKIHRNSEASSSLASSSVLPACANASGNVRPSAGTDGSILMSAPPLGLTVPEALAHAGSTDDEPTKDDAVSPQEAFLLCHMFSLDETFDRVQSTTVLCDDVSPLDGEGTLPTDDYEEKPSRLSEEDSAKDTNTTRQAVRCMVRFPLRDVVSTAAAEAISKVMGPCHSGHYGPNLNRVLCGMSATTPADFGTSRNRYRYNHNGLSEDGAKWLLTQVLGAGMSGITMMELAHHQEKSSSNQSLVDIAQSLVRDGLISIVHAPTDYGNQQAHHEMTAVFNNTSTARFIDPVYASPPCKIANAGDDEADAPSSSSWSGTGSSRGRSVDKKIQHHHLRCKVVLLLTQKPGCYLGQIHATVCPQLSLDQAVTLLGDMENDGLLFSRKCSMSIGIASPFDCIDNTCSRRKTLPTGNIAFFLRF